MGTNIYPTPSSGGLPFTSQPPVNASSVLLDGKLSTVGSYTTNITGNGGAAYIVSSQQLNVTINGTKTVVYPNTLTLTSNAFSGSVSATVQNSYSNPPSGTWTTSQSNVGYIGNNVWYIGSVYVTTQVNTTGTIQYSSNGSTWTSVYIWTGTPNSPGFYYQNMNQAGNTIMACNGSYVATTTDGINWTLKGNLSTGVQNSRPFGDGNGKWFIYDTSGNDTSGPGNYTTDNGANWARIYGLGATGGIGGYVNGYWFAASYTQQYIYYGTVPGTWTLSVMNIGAPRCAYSGNGVGLIAINTGANLYSTTNPSVGWTKSQMPYTADSINYVNGYYVAGTYDVTNTIMYSTDYTTWTIKTVSTVGNYFNSVAGDGNGQFLATSTAQNSNGNVAKITVTSPGVPTNPIKFGIYAGPAAIH